MSTLDKIQAAGKAGQLLPSSVEIISTWLAAGLPTWAVESIDELVAKGAWSELNDRFYRYLEFGTGGMRSIDITRWAGNDVDIRAARRMDDGRIVMAGALYGDDSIEALVARLLPNGDIDTTFGDQGWTQIGGGAILVATAIAFDDIGRVLLAGGALDEGVADRPIVARLGMNGAPDAGFGTG